MVGRKGSYFPTLPSLLSVPRTLPTNLLSKLQEPEPKETRNSFGWDQRSLRRLERIPTGNVTGSRRRRLSYDGSEVRSSIIRMTGKFLLVWLYG